MKRIPELSVPSTTYKTDCNGAADLIKPVGLGPIVPTPAASAYGIYKTFQERIERCG